MVSKHEIESIFKWLLYKINYTVSDRALLCGLGSINKINAHGHLNPVYIP